jgi:4-hydroxybenzoate polyprenyltransferase
MRFDKPIGSLLLLWPTLWALWIAQHGIPSYKILIIFVLGVFIMRSAGCVINDLADQKFDGSVSRTKQRPLVVGSVNSSEAILLFIFLCFLSLLLVLQLNFFTIKLSVIALILAICYPFSKRFMPIPQVILGAAFAWSVPMVFAALHSHVPWEGWLLYALAAVWPVAYDSIYALMDREEDLKIGVKSTAILFGRYDLLIISLLQLFVLFGLCFIGYRLKFSVLFYLSFCVAFVLMGYQFLLIKSRTIENYYRAFKCNNWVGLSIFLGIFTSYL